MAISVVKRPQGISLQNFFPQPATVTVDIYDDDAMFFKTGHGIVTGDFVYIISNIRNYSGFWHVTVVTANYFKISEYPGAEKVGYINDDTVTYYAYQSVNLHAWNAVHLPIVYKLASTLWPVNTEDSVRTVSTSANAFGYTRLTLSGDIKATGSAQELDYVKATVNGTESIYQIIQRTSDTDFVIDLAYLGTNTFGNIQFYYNNYHARIKIYAGFPSSHRWQAQKPFAYLTEIKQSPDSDNIVSVNINEYIKSQIAILTNDLLLGTLPNDINAFCYFYIQIAESFDQPLDGYTLGTAVSAYTTDYLEGVAVNAELPFKNVHSGYMSAYLGTRKFLTLFTEPTLFAGYWFELGFLVDAAIGTNALKIVQKTYKAGVLQNTYNENIGSDIINLGVWRFPVAAKADEDRQDIYLDNGGFSVSETITINVNNECGSQAMQFQWLNMLGGYDTFVFKTQKDDGIEIVETVESSKSIMGNWPDSYSDIADTINREIKRDSNESVTVYSENVTEIELNAIRYIKTSPLVQILSSRRDKRTVIIDRSSFTYKQDGAKTFNITFKAVYTDMIGSQNL